MSEIQEKIREFAPYLQDLVRRLYFLTVFFSATFAAGFLTSAPTIRFLTKFFDFKDVVLAATSPFQLVDLAMNIGLFFATTLTIPLFLYHFYAFIAEGLKRKEKKFFFLMVPIIILLFLLGFFYGFYILYFTMQKLADVNIGLGVKNLWDIDLFLTQILSTSALLGLVFEFPILVTTLVKFGIVSVDFLKKKRRYVIFGMFVFTSLLPPTDGISLLLMVSPLIVMYEITILYNQLKYRQLVRIIK